MNYRSWCRWPRCTSRTIWRQSGPFWTWRRIFLRSRASIRRSIAARHTLPSPSRCHAASPKRASDDTASTACPTNISYRVCTNCAPERRVGRVVIAHLGNGASLCAVKEGRSVASTMGFTAVDGLMMGTRCGALDPGVILYLMQAHRHGRRRYRGSDLPASRACLASPAFRRICARFEHRPMRRRGKRSPCLCIVSSARPDP